MNTRAVEHFLKLASRGRGRGASGGEVRASKLAAMIVDCAPGLDDEALTGAADFIRIASAAPGTAYDLLQEAS